jgi:hypothetical protein
VTRHYHVIGNFSATMAKRFVCKACGKGCERNIKHTCDQTCSDCMVSPPCVRAGVRIPSADCNRHLRSQTCSVNRKLELGNKKSVCERKRFCRSCEEFIIPGKKYECGKNFCDTCKANREDISVISNHWRTCCHQATEYCMYPTILKRRRLHGTLILLNYTFLNWCVYSSFVLAVRALTISIRTVHSAKRGNMHSGRIQCVTC